MRVLVVGCGSVGQRHIGNFQKLGVDIGAVDTREDRRQEVSDRFGISEVFEGLDEALGNAFDAVVVAVPTSYHLGVAEKAIAKGLHLLVEKPIADSTEGLIEIIKQAEDKGLVFLVGYTYRFWPPLRRIKALLDQCELGRIYSVQIVFSEYLPDWHPWEDYRGWFMANKQLGGGAILDQSHTLDFARWLFGEIGSVFCVNGRLSHLEITSDDLAEMVVLFQSGTVGSVHMDTYGRHHRKEMVIIGEKGNCYWDFYSNVVKVYQAEGKTWQTWQFACERNDMFVDEGRHFLDCIANKSKPAVDGRDGLKTLQVILAGMESSRTGRMVPLAN